MGAMSSISTLVIGGAGRTGRHVVRALDGLGVTARVMSRRDLKSVGPASVVRGDVTDAASVKAAMAGAGAVVVILESAHSRGDPTIHERVHHGGVRNVIEAARPNGAHVVLVTQIYITRPDRMRTFRELIEWRGRGEEALRESGLPYTIVRPSWLTNEPGGERAIRFEQGDTGEGEIARADVATVCAHAILEPDARGKTFELYNEPGSPPADWAKTFAALAPDGR